MTNTTEPTITNVSSDNLDILDIALFPDEINADDYALCDEVIIDDLLFAENAAFDTTE